MPSGQDYSRREPGWVRHQEGKAIYCVPASGDPWLVLDVGAAPHQEVQAGDVIATVVPIDRQTHQPGNLTAYLDVEEKHFGDLKPEQLVRLYSTMYNHRLHGHATAWIERLEPVGKLGADGKRHFHAQATITQAPFVLPLGSSFQAEIVVGRKTVYRIIVER